MNVKQWIALLMLYVGYLIVGAAVFYYLEKDQETIKRNEDFQMYKDLVDILRSCGINKTATLSLETYCGRPLTENAEIDEVSQEYWTFYKSVVFVLTVVSTIGYGNINPTMPLTRYLMIIYAVIGLPINGILLTSLASFFSTVFIRAHRKYKRYESRFGLFVDVLTYLIPGILFFIFIPATAFYYFEEWTYEESVYFAFVTLTTIGFGDYVAGQKSYKSFNSQAVIIYKTLLLGWIIFGLGYLIMLLGYLTRAMRSKKVIQLEQKLVEALTHSKIWHGFTKDLGYMRRIMNEVYLDKFKPVFRDERLRFLRKHTHRRSKSLPNIIFGIDDETLFDESQTARNKGESAYIPCRAGFTRVFSESDLTRIDRHATFASTTAIRPSELLRQVVGAMEGSMLCNQDDSRGINVFSDDEILQSEAWHDLKKDNPYATLYHPPSYEDIVAAKRRERSFSEIPPEKSNRHTITASCDIRGGDRTLSGAAEIFQLINEKQNNSQQENFKNKSLNKSHSFLGGAKWFNPLRKKRFYSESPNSSGSKNSVVHKPELRYLENIKMLENEHRKTSLYEGGTTKYRSDMSYMTHTAGTGTKGLGLMHGRISVTHIDANVPYKYSTDVWKKGNQKFLDETSLGDFLRALTVLHNRLGGRQSQTEDEYRIYTPPPPQSHSLVDLSPTKETPSLLWTIAGANLNRTESMPITSDKEPSNLKRLGRFLLRSYSPKSESIADLSFPPSENAKLKQNEPEESSQPESVLSVRFGSTQLTPSFEENETPAESVIRSNTMDSCMKKTRQRSLGNPFRPTVSTESVNLSQEGRNLPNMVAQPRQTSLRWRNNNHEFKDESSGKTKLK